MARIVLYFPPDDEAPLLTGQPPRGGGARVPRLPIRRLVYFPTEDSFVLPAPIKPDEDVWLDQFTARQAQPWTALPFLDTDDILPFPAADGGESPLLVSPGRYETAFYPAGVGDDPIAAANVLGDLDIPPPVAGPWTWRNLEAFFDDADMPIQPLGLEEEYLPAVATYRDGWWVPTYPGPLPWWLEDSDFIPIAPTPGATRRPAPDIRRRRLLMIRQWG